MGLERDRGIADWERDLATSFATYDKPIGPLTYKQWRHGQTGVWLVAGRYELANDHNAAIRKVLNHHPGLVARYARVVPPCDVPEDFGLYLNYPAPGWPTGQCYCPECQPAIRPEPVKGAEVWLWNWARQEEE